jgi:zinc protease
MTRLFLRRCILMILCLLWLVPGLLPGAANDEKIQLPLYKKVKLDNGMTLLLMERHQLPLVSFQWLMKSGGGVCDPPGKEGLAALTSQLLRKGTGSRSADQIAEALDFVGATYEASASQEFSAGTAEFLKKDLPLAIALISEMLMHPSFPQAEIEKMIQREIDGIKEEKAVPQRVIQRYYDGFLFGSHPYARPAGGTETSLGKITRDDITGFYSTHYVPNELVLAVVGDFNFSEMEASLKERLGSWKSGEVRLPAIQDAPSVQGKQILVVDKPDSTQTFFRLGNVGVARTSPDWISLQVVNTLFGGRFTSMINSTLRIQSGLTYGANSFFSSRKNRGSFTIGSYTPTGSTARALDLTLEVLKTLHEKGIDEAQLKSAKNYIKGQFGPTIETNEQLAETIVELEFYGLKADFINTYFDKIDAMTLADAKRMISTYFPQENLSFVLIGKASEIEPIAKKLGREVKKKLITDPGF